MSSVGYTINVQNNPVDRQVPVILGRKWGIILWGGEGDLWWDLMDVQDNNTIINRPFVEYTQPFFKKKKNN